MNNNKLENENIITKDHTTLISVKDNFINTLSIDETYTNETNNIIDLKQKSKQDEIIFNNLKSNQNIETLSNDTLENKENINKIETISKNKNYYRMIYYYFIYLLFGFIGGLYINLISNVNLINFDMLFNIIISPILFYHSPRNILMNLYKIDLIKYYCIPFLVGLHFRFFDRIPGFSQFILDPYYIKSTLQITLLIVVLSIIFILSIYYIYISSNPILNTVLFVSELFLTVISCYYYLLHNGYIHIHHYFIGLVIMLVSRNYHSKIVVIAHAISYAIYIEGISGYGFDKIYWQI